MYSVTALMCIVTTHALGKQLPARGKIITRGATMNWFEVAQMLGIGYVAVSTVTYITYLIFQTLRR